MKLHFYIVLQQRGWFVLGFLLVVFFFTYNLQKKQNHRAVSCMQFNSLQTVFEPKYISYYTLLSQAHIIISGAVLPLVPYS